MTWVNNKLIPMPIVVSNNAAKLLQLVFVHFSKPLYALNNFLNLFYELLSMFYLNINLITSQIYILFIITIIYLDRSNVFSSISESSSKFLEFTVDNIPSSDLWIKLKKKYTVAHTCIGHLEQTYAKTESNDHIGSAAYVILLLKCYSFSVALLQILISQYFYEDAPYQHTPNQFLQLLHSEKTLANLSNDCRSFFDTLFQDLDNLINNTTHLEIGIQSLNELKTHL
ncbi:hypothetical protein AGLY_004284 [Aphis glycines]|uniref:Uncharacterized protein n=1 Tax=Aphis glycines TaxID=307491 RepID=A0A6G0TXL8_APHGL|nr:hypothetical protein AGLY_004284 [Aphis glycines]